MIENADLKESVLEQKNAYAAFRRCETKAQLFRAARKLPVIGKKVKRARYGAQPIMTTPDGRAVLTEAIRRGEPFMAARFGTTEGAAFVSYWKLLLSADGDFSTYPQIYLDNICTYSGFFPNDKEILRRWGDMETEACRDLDLLGVMNFLNEEWLARTLCPQARLMPNGGLASAAHGWAPVLEGRKVLVAHPFTDTIRSQYENHREEIFPGTNALPAFDIRYVKAVQTIADQKDPRFETWFDALDYMTAEIEKQDFDVALLGCGAYGFPLAARVKRMGKIAVHMGGSLQTLFGIKGARWDRQYADMYNDAWVYPSQAETPQGFEKVEGGCYWK